MTQYKGTGVTGTSTTGKVFPKSGVAKAVAGSSPDTYLNTTTGHSYRCTTAGDANTAKWAYTSTSIIAKPSVGVTSLAAPERGDGRRFSTSWKVPDALTNEKKGDRAEKLDIGWETWVDENTVYTPTSTYVTVGTGVTSRTINLGSVRDKFYPLTKRKLAALGVWVEPKNSKGQGSQAREAKRKFTAPRKPTISAPEWNASGDNGEVTATIRTDAGEDYRERYDTRYKVTVYDSRTGKTVTKHNTSTQATSISISVEVSGWGALAVDNDHVKVMFEAWSRGFAGDSDHVTKSLVVGWPATPAIGGWPPTVNGKANKAPKSTSAGAAGVTVVSVDTNSSASHPVDHVRLCALVSTSASTAAEARDAEGWEETDIVDDAQCTSMAINVVGEGGIKPAAGMYTWLRLKSWHLDETQFHRYSAPVRVKDLETPSPESDNTCEIISAVTSEDGQGVYVTVGWNSSDGTKGGEVSWSKHDNAWRSTEQPDSFEFDWSASNTGTWNRKAVVEVRGLDEGETYYFRARRYDVVDDSNVYGKYSSAVSCTPASEPSEVVLTAPAYLPRGSSVAYSWTFESGSQQRAWQLRRGKVNVAEGADSHGSFVLDAETAAARAAETGDSSALAVRVFVSTGGDFVASNAVTTRFADPPTAAVEAETLTAQPLSVSLESDTAGCSAVVKVRAQGVSATRPDGEKVQAAGDTVWSALLQPEWVTPTGQDTASATVELPSGLDFVDGAAYTVEVVLTDPVTGLASDTAAADFSVAWAHQAQMPSDGIELEPEAAADPVTGAVTRRVAIALSAPAGAAEGDVYDIYRMDGPNAVLAASGAALDAVLADELAPFGDGLTLSYRIALRTPDGDVEWADYDYMLDGGCIRVDYPGGSVELPWNQDLSEKRSKDFEKRRHMDGTDAGYWNAGVDRSASLGSDAVGIDEQGVIDAVRALGDHAGAVFVRTPDGRAYCANVDVGKIAAKSSRGLVSIDLDADEIALDDGYRIPLPVAEEAGE